MLPISKQLLARVILISLVCIPVSAYCQSNFADKIPGWKASFPKQDIIEVVVKQIVNFTLDASAKEAGEKVKAVVSNESVLVPVRDYLKYEDGLFYSDEVSIDKLKVTNAENKEISVTKLCGDYSSEDIFHSDAKFCSVKFPLAEKGKPFTIKYDEAYKNVKYLTSFYFTDGMPMAEKIVQFNIPSWLEIDFREFNFAGYDIKKQVTKTIEGSQVTFIVNNVQAYVRESHAPNHALSYPHIITVVKAFTEGSTRNILFEKVDNVYAWYSSLCKEVDNDATVIATKVTELTAGKKTAQEKIENIYYWVQDNIRYIAFENGIMGFKPEAAQNVFKNKYGDCKGKANLLKTMLTAAGFDARLTWIGTSDLPYDYTLPSLVVDNHMICTVILEGKRYFLDGTESFIAFNDYAQRIQGKQVMIEDGPKYIIDKIPEFPSQRNKQTSVKKLNIEDANLVGNQVDEYNGESKINVQGAYAATKSDKKNETLTNYLSNGDGNVEVSDITSTDFTDRQKPLQLKFKIKANNQVTKTGDELYVVLDWDKEFKSMEMPEERKNDYEFSQKYFITTQTELTIPQGYKVDYLPATFRKTSANWSFEGAYANKGNVIIYTKTIAINKPILRKSEFKDWNDFISGINTFYNDQIVLKK